MEILKVLNISKKFGKVVAVDNVSFAVNEGEILVLLGPSGSGKTVTLRCIAGLEKPDSGEIIVENRTVFSAEKGVWVPPEKRNIGMVFQIFAVWPHMTVFDNIAYPLKLRKLPKDEIMHRVSEVIKLTGLKGLENRYPSQLSGGQQQRVALARALVMGTKIILFDEPMSNLDAKLAERLRFEIKKLIKSLSTTAIYVTHDQLEALLMADRVGVMNNGRLVELSSVKEIYSKPTHAFTAEFIGTTNTFKGKVVRKYSGNVLMVNTALGEIYGTSYDQSIKEGDEVTIAFKADKVNILPEIKTEFKETKNVLHGKIVLYSFTGEKNVYEIEVDGQILRAHTLPEIELNIGSSIALYLKPDDILILKQ